MQSLSALHGTTCQGYLEIRKAAALPFATRYGVADPERESDHPRRRLVDLAAKAQIVPARTGAEGALPDVQDRAAGQPVGRKELGIKGGRDRTSTRRNSR